MRDGLMAVNDALLAEFTRNSGSNDRFEFVLWVAWRTREAIAGLHDEPSIARARWGALTRHRQRVVLLDYLKSLPAAANSEAYA